MTKGRGCCVGTSDRVTSQTVIRASAACTFIVEPTNAFLPCFYFIIICIIFFIDTFISILYFFITSVYISFYIILFFWGNAVNKAWLKPLPIQFIKMMLSCCVQFGNQRKCICLYAGISPHNRGCDLCTHVDCVHTHSMFAQVKCAHTWTVREQMVHIRHNGLEYILYLYCVYVSTFTYSRSRDWRHVSPLDPLEHHGSEVLRDLRGSQMDIHYTERH